MARGKRAEKEFAGMYLSDPKNVVINPTEKQDCEEHWDLMINDCKVDVKAIKKNNENIHFIEFKNVQGKRGWLYGNEKTDMAFEGWLQMEKYKDG